MTKHFWILQRMPHVSVRSMRLLIPLTVALITAAVYLPALSFGFVLDDHEQIVLSQPNLTPSRLPYYFTSDVLNGLQLSAVKNNYYRPLFLTWLMLNYQWCGADSVLWHLSTLIAHMVATLLLYFLVLTLAGDPVVAGMAALLFGIHPVHVEGVAWISGVTEPLFAILLFAALYLYLGGARILSWLAFLLALFAKETAFGLPLLIFVHQWLTTKRARVAVAATGPYAGVALLYLAIRFAVLGRLEPLTRAWPLSTVAKTLPSVLSFYLRQLVWPFEYALWYPLAPVTHPGLKVFFLPILITASAAAILIWISRWSEVAAFASLILTVPLLPVLNLRAFAFDDFVHDRYLYVPCAGFCILLALGLRRLRRPVMLGILAPLCLLLAVETVRASLPWNDNLALFGRAMQVAPESIVAYEYMGGELLGQQRYADALPLLIKALYRYPPPAGIEYYGLNKQIAHCYFGLEEWSHAAIYIRNAIGVDARNPADYNILALTELRQGKLADAEGHARRALQLGQGTAADADFHAVLAMVLEAKGDAEGARAENAQAKALREARGN